MVVGYEEYNLRFGFNICVVCSVIEDCLSLFLVWYRNRLGCMSGAIFCRTVFLFLNMCLYLIKPELSIFFVACGIERMYFVTVFY